MIHCGHCDKSFDSLEDLFEHVLNDCSTEKEDSKIN
jgi:hypothetical protein